MGKTFTRQLVVPAAIQLLMSQAMAQPACDPLKAALAFIAKQYPNFDLTKKQVISERGDLWQLTYELPEDMLGGVPTIMIDKRTCAVVHAIHTQ
jgi:NTF2 fold immunity protein